VTRAIPILMYHQIDAMPPAGTPFRHLTVTPAAFAAQMRWMHRLGYRGLSMRDLQPYLSGERRGRVFGITFDDGYLNVLRHALPVLRDVGFSATNYVVANRVGGTNDWDAAHGIRQVPLMSAGELRQWAAAGQEIGSHTTDHVDLTRQEPEQARAQIAWSRQLLQAMTDQPVDAFCFPYGRYDEHHVELAREAGYRNATTIQRGRARPGDDAWQLPRITVDGTAGVAAFLAQLLTPYEDWRAGWQRFKRARTRQHG